MNFLSFFKPVEELGAARETARKRRGGERLVVGRRRHGVRIATLNTSPRRFAAWSLQADHERPLPTTGNQKRRKLRLASNGSLREACVKNENKRKHALHPPPTLAVHPPLGASLRLPALMRRSRRHPRPSPWLTPSP